MRSWSLSLLVCLAVAIYLSSCEGGQHSNAATQDLSMREKMYYEQYMVQGHQLYDQYCVNCHQEDGSGLGELIPPLAQADYLLEDTGRAACLIKHGMEGEIVVNGVVYNQPMPANEQLTNIEIAQLLTYIANSWGNEEGYIPVKTAEEYLDQCDN